MSGLGRGGRGALLLKALETQVKLPGQPPGDEKKPSGPGQQRQSPPQPDASTQRQSPPSGATGGPGGRQSKSPPQRQSPPTAGMSAMAIQEEKQPKREKGTAGTQVPICVNYIPLRSTSSGMHQYAIAFSPDIESRPIRAALLFHHDDLIKGARTFDGCTLLLPYELPEQIITRRSTRTTDNTQVEITITYVKKLSPAGSTLPYNMIFKKVMRMLKLQQITRYYYDPTRSIPVPQHKLELWPGYITAIQQYEGGLMLMADVSHKLLRSESVLQFLYEIHQRSKHDFHNEVTKQLVGAVVLTRYNNATYKVDDIAWDKKPTDTFQSHDGTMISYIEYYKKAYGKTITDEGQPLLIHRPKKVDTSRKGQSRQPLDIVCLVPELCSMTGLTDNMRADFRVMKDLGGHTRVTPNQRQQSLLKFVDNVNGNKEVKDYLKSWGLELDNSLLKTTGRQFAEEKINMMGTSTLAGSQADWGRAATNSPLISVVNLDHWTVLFTNRDMGKATDYVNMMKRCTNAMGIKVSDPRMFRLADDRTESYLKALRECINPQLQLVVIIFPTSRDDRYAAVKKLCCVESPIPSQVINARTISQQQKLKSVTQKIALQINCKLGGELWSVDIPLTNVMVIGIDVYHDSVGGGRSIGAFCASTNKTFTKWFSKVCFQMPGQELIDGLKVCFTSALRKYHELNHELPQRIFVYRDGVGDGQLDVVAQYEVQQLIQCFGFFGEEYNPKMAVIVVQKRINTRIFSTLDVNSRAPQLENPAPGTVLDHTITRRDWFDFFLVSQHVRQGTVTPTHYIAVYDTSGLKADHLQRLTYKLTHLYYNWPGTIRVPAPCQYAHKIAFLVGQSLHKAPDEKLSDRLFFL